jgi:hypothetical protein
MLFRHTFTASLSIPAIAPPLIEYSCVVFQKVQLGAAKRAVEYCEFSHGAPPHRRVGFCVSIKVSRCVAGQCRAVLRAAVISHRAAAAEHITGVVSSAPPSVSTSDEITGRRILSDAHRCAWVRG